MSSRAFLAFLGVLAVVGLLAYGLVSKGEAKITVGEPVPDKSLTGLGSTNAGTLAAYRGKWMLVNLWASWCEPCRKESPVLQRYWERHRHSGFTVVGIDVQDNVEDAEAFLRRYRLSYPEYWSKSDDRSRAFGSTGVPESFLVNPAGRLALIRRGVVDQRYLDRFVTPLIER